jgi:peptidylprolyl isomerase domain and WD repeat-containing protein 1
LFNSAAHIFFLQFTKREPEDTKTADSDRDVFNEKPSKEEVMAATQAEGPKRVSDSAIVHTSMGDIHIKLFPVEYVKPLLSYTNTNVNIFGV